MNQRRWGVREGAGATHRRCSMYLHVYEVIDGMSSGLLEGNQREMENISASISCVHPLLLLCWLLI